MGRQSEVSTLQRATAAWEEFTSTGCVGPGAIVPEVLESWKRCRSMGMDPYQVNHGVALTPEELLDRAGRKKELLELSLPVMREVYAVVKGSGFVAILTDEDGVILEAFGDAEMTESGKKANLFRGAVWREEVAGTSAIALTLNTRRPIQIAGAEHYFAHEHTLTCSAAPIFDPEGNLTGVFNMTAHSEQVHPHTLGMVVAAARAIQYGLRVWKDTQRVRLANHFMKATQESISDGLLVLDAKGNIADLNRQAARILGLSPELARGKPVATVLRGQTSLLKVLEKGQPLADSELILETTKRRVSVHVDAQPIRDDEAILGVVAVVSESKKLHRLVNQISGAQARFHFEDIVGESDAIRRALKMAQIAARSRSTVLIEGESGTGKELFAQAIHNDCDARAPFVAVNCAAIPATLIESELFGYEGGAFTGASPGGRPGKFELANGGTLFLDEISSLPLTLQAVLLRALQERAVVRVGGHRVIPVSVRIIAASNRDLTREVKQGNFREDLYYRLNVLRISVPPLRDRPSDIPLLVDLFVRQVGEQCGKTIKGTDPAVMEALQRYQWPGNIRQLQNVVERAVNFAQGEHLTVETLPDYVLDRSDAHGTEAPECRVTTEDFPDLKPEELAEQSRLQAVITQFDGNLVKAAKALGIGRSTLYRRLRRFGLTPQLARDFRDLRLG
ncbi:MAG: sigma 54-interacting transcriptional regulator [Firmicutes bacterium]|nr:sigma 54-interacting transcriptional regulator [Bacillota bacterium]